VISRREFFLSVSTTLAAPLLSEAQPVRKVPTVGYVFASPDPECKATPVWEAFIGSLRDFGWVPGQTITVERRCYTTMDQLRAILSEFIERRVDVIAGPTSQQAFPARQATRTIPIVVFAAHGAVETGLVASLARPGGNVTGNESLAAELDAKRLELIKEILPQVSHVALLHDATDVGSRVHLEWTRTAARRLGIDVRPLPVRDGPTLDSALAGLTTERPDAALTFTDGNGLLFPRARRIADAAAKLHIPTVFEFSEFVGSGGLLSYGARLADLFSRGAYYVDRVLRGAKPGEVPMEQSARFELVVNLKTARSIGLTIPPAVLLRADQIIQ
jgi:putative ABC transport system substrate-binding protein